MAKVQNLGRTIILAVRMPNVTGDCVTVIKGDRLHSFTSSLNPVLARIPPECTFAPTSQGAATRFCTSTRCQPRCRYDFINLLLYS